MKIIHIISDLNTGGMQKFCVDICNIQNKENDVEILILGQLNSDFELSSSIKITALNKSLSVFNLGLFYSIYQFIASKKSQYVIVHTHGISLFFSLFSILFLKRKNAFVHTIHNLCQNEAGNVRRLINFILYKFKYVSPVTISKDVDESFIRYYKDCNRTLILNGVSDKSFINNNEPIDYLVTDVFGTEHNLESFVLYLNVGRFDIQKNRSVLFDSFYEFSKDRNYKLLVVGGNPDLENEIFTNLADHNGIHEGNIILIGNTKNIETYYAKSHYFVLSSLFEGLPLSLLEAMSFGLICLSTPAGGCKSVLENIGFLSSDFSRESLLKLFKRTESIDQSLYHKKFKSEFNSKYTMEICSQNYERLYKRLLQ